MHTHTYTHTVKWSFKKTSLATTLRALPWLSPSLMCMLSGLTDLETSLGKGKDYYHSDLHTVNSWA